MKYFQYIVLALLTAILATSCLTCSTVKQIQRQVDVNKAKINTLDSLQKTNVTIRQIDDVLQEHFLLEEMSDKNQIPIKSMYLNRNKYLKDNKK